jgi:flavin-dependent dehydrogenase
MRSQVAIIGGGPGGASAALQLAQHGVQCVIVERETFPRYHIGESMTGEAGALLRELGLGDRMLAAAHPQKQGVKVYGRSAWFMPVMMREPSGELVAQFTWQVRRSEFDRMLLDEAVARGATLLPGRATGVVRSDDGTVCGVRVARADGETETLECDLLIDASGQRTFLAKKGVTSEKLAGRYDKQVAIFSQVKNTIRESGEREHHGDNTLIFYKSKYHWAWFIPLDDRVVSVGVVVDGSYFASQKESKRDFLRRELRELHPELARRVPDPELLEEARAIPNYSYFVENFTGKGFLCLGDAHRFIDPIFSFGLYLTMKEAQLATPHILRYLRGETAHADNPFAEHQADCTAAMDALQDLIDAFWEDPVAFSLLVNGERTRGDLIDLFAGRVFHLTPTRGLGALRKIASQARGLAITQRAEKYRIGEYPWLER